jgi:hypothetical protein
MAWPNIPYGPTWEPVPPPAPEPEEVLTQPPIAGAQDDDAVRNAAAGLPADTVWSWFPEPEEGGPDGYTAGWRP